MDYVVKHPADCTAEELGEFHALVVKGGEVSAEGLLERIKRAYRLGFCFDGVVLVAVAGLKRPDDGYKERVFNRAGVSNPNDFALEIGWAYTDVPYRRRGIATRLFRTLIVSTAELVFATTRVENKTCKGILERMKLRATGKPFEGRTSQLALYTWSK